MAEDGREFEAVVELVAEVEEDLETGRRHYRDVEGRLLGTLDEVVRACLEGKLLTQGRQGGEVGDASAC